MKVVINRCFGGFGLSDEAMQLYAAKKGIKLEGFYDWEISRNDPVLVEVVEHLGESANGWAADLKVVEIPDGVDWYVEDYDGVEHIAERHRTWS